MMDELYHWIVIGNPENRRVKLFIESLLKAQQASRSQQSSFTVISYIELLQNIEYLECFLLKKLSGISGRIIIRFDSPGENHLLEQQLVFLSQHQKLSGFEQQTENRGQILNVSDWFSGYSQLLHKIEQSLYQVLNQLDLPFYSSNPASEILCLFDKVATAKKLQKNKIRTAKKIEGVNCFEQLIERMNRDRKHRIFIKLRYSSSASGVAAFQYNSIKNQFILTSSIEMVKLASSSLAKPTVQFFNSLKMKTYTNVKDVKRIVDFLFSQDVIVEDWLVKAQQAGENYDLRIVSIAAKPEFIVVRRSKSPITNLHLGNQRVEFEALNLSAQQKEHLLDTVNQAADAFKNMITIGWDLLLTRKNKTAYIIEGNAFGDLLPGMKNKMGNTYDNQIVACQQLAEKSCC